MFSAKINDRSHIFGLFVCYTFIWLIHLDAKLEEVAVTNWNIREASIIFRRCSHRCDSSSISVGLLNNERRRNSLLDFYWEYHKTRMYERMRPIHRRKEKAFASHLFSIIRLFNQYKRFCDLLLHIYILKPVSETLANSDRSSEFWRFVNDCVVLVIERYRFHPKFTPERRRFCRSFPYFSKKLEIEHWQSANERRKSSSTRYWLKWSLLCSRVADDCVKYYILYSIWSENESSGSSFVNFKVEKQSMTSMQHFKWRAVLLK